MPVARAAAKKTAAPKTTRTAAKKVEAVDTLTYEMEFDRATPGTYKYTETGEKENFVSGAQYLKKTAVGDEPPKKIRVTIEAIG